MFRRFTGFGLVESKDAVEFFFKIAGVEENTIQDIFIYGQFQDYVKGFMDGKIELLKHKAVITKELTLEDL
jgi:hypothetical protein